MSERHYGDVTLKGYVYSDTVCLQLNSCISDFEYFAIQEQRGLREPIDGMLGLARGLNTFHQGEGSVETSKSFVTALKDKGLIDKETFSFYFQN